MRNQLLTVLCASCLVIGVQAQTSTDPSSSSSSGQSGSSSSGQSGYSGQSGQSGTSGSQSGWTGRMSSMGHQELRASQLTGAQITSSSGSQIGTISDVIINPGSGRIDFAVLSLSSSGAGSTGGATSPSGTSSSTGSSTSSDTSSSGSSSAVGGSSTAGGSSLGASSSSGKQVAVPWMLLRSSSTGTSSTSQQPSFVFTGETTKLQSAPSFDATTDLTQPGWRHSVFSYFGLSSGSATGASETPGGSSSSGSLQDTTSGSPK